LNHHTHSDFWECYRALPKDIQGLADKAFVLLKQDARHSSLRFKKVGPYWSARVGRQYRALAMEAPDGLLWFWIGTHAEYDRLLA
jgi:hypothetical protein